MKYGYVRVSTQTQNIATQIEELYKLGLTDDVIFIGKVERPLIEQVIKYLSLN